jgi:hypothetical protein
MHSLSLIVRNPTRMPYKSFRVVVSDFAILARESAVAEIDDVRPE